MKLVLIVTLALSLPLISAQFKHGILNVNKGCLSEPTRDNDSTGILIHAQNVENLFDWKHDPKKWDYGYLPLEQNGQLNEFKVKGCKETSSQFFLARCLNNDWTKDVYEQKQQKLVELFTQAEKHYGKQDILVLTEIENPAVAYDLGTRLGYFPRNLRPRKESTDYSEITEKGSKPCDNTNVPGLAMTNNPDKRGIDIAIIFNSKKLTQVACREHIAGKSDPEGGRNIIEVLFQEKHSPHRKFVVYGNHWPSQFAPLKARQEAAQTLKRLMAQHETQSPGLTQLATGDFNTIDSDFKTTIDPLLAEPFLDSAFNRIKKEKRRLPIAGTYYYSTGLIWSLFDQFIFRSNRKAMTVDLDSYQVHNFAKFRKAKRTWIFRSSQTAWEIKQKMAKATAKELTDYKKSHNFVCVVPREKQGATVNFSDLKEFLTRTKEKKREFFFVPTLYQEKLGSDVRILDIQGNPVLKITDPQVVQSFEDDSDLDSLLVIEHCAPKRTSVRFDKVTNKNKLQGYSDHFGISIRLR